MENLAFVVRKAEISDAKKIQEITREAFEMYRESAGVKDLMPALEETLEDIAKDIETKEVFVALLNNKIVGSVRVEIKDDKSAYLSRFSVERHNQNSGVGKMMMNVVDISMVTAGVTNLYLHTASKLFALVRFYYGRGFYIDSTTTDKGYIRALMCKEYSK